MARGLGHPRPKAEDEPNPVMDGGGIALLVIAPIVAWFGRASQTATATPPPQPAQAFSPYAGYR